MVHISLDHQPHGATALAIICDVGRKKAMMPQPERARVSPQPDRHDGKPSLHLSTSLRRLDKKAAVKKKKSASCSRL